MTYSRRYSLKDVIVGKIFFLLVRIKVKYMELSIIRRETIGTGILSSVPIEHSFYQHRVNSTRMKRLSDRKSWMALP